MTNNRFHQFHRNSFEPVETDFGEERYCCFCGVSVFDVKEQNEECECWNEEESCTVVDCEHTWDWE